MKDKVVIWGIAGIIVSAILSMVEIYKVIGIPAHPLLVHLPVVLIPLVAIGTIAMVFKREWVTRFSVLIMALVIVGFAFTILAAGAGEQLMEHGVRNSLVQDHEEAADRLRILMFIFSIAAVTLAGWHRRNAAPVVLRVLVGIVAALSLGSVIQTGHLGSKAVWQNKGGISQDSGTRNGPDGDDRYSRPQFTPGRRS